MEDLSNHSQHQQELQDQQQETAAPVQSQNQHDGHEPSSTLDNQAPDSGHATPSHSGQDPEPNKVNGSVPVHAMELDSKHLILSQTTNALLESQNSLPATTASSVTVATDGGNDSSGMDLDSHTETSDRMVITSAEVSRAMTTTTATDGPSTRGSHHHVLPSASALAALENLDSAISSAVAAVAASTAAMASSSSTTTTTTITTTVPIAISAADAAMESSLDSRDGAARLLGGGVSNTNNSDSSTIHTVHMNSTNANTGISTGSTGNGGGSSSGGGLSVSAPLINSSGQDVNNRFHKNPVVIRWPANDWESWLQAEKTHCRWNLIRHRHRDKQTFARGPTASEWTREYQCDHAGQYRDRKNPNIEAKKKRKRAESIKCGCTAFIKMRKHFHDDDVVIEYSWKHEGHIPDVMEDIKAQRLPQDLKAWIKRRIIDGQDWKSVKNILVSGSSLLDELHPTTRQNVKQLLQSCYAQYANTARQILKSTAREAATITAGASASSSTASSSAGKARNGGSELQLANGEDTDMPLATASTAGSSSVSSPRMTPSATRDHRDGSSLSQDKSNEGTRTPTWDLAELNSAAAAVAAAAVHASSSTSHNFSTGSGTLQGDHTPHDGQTLAVHSLRTVPTTSSSTTDPHHQVLALNGPLLVAESISRAIREQHGFSLVDGTTAAPTQASVSGASSADTSSPRTTLGGHGVPDAADEAVSAAAAAAADLIYQHHQTLQGAADSSLRTTTHSQDPTAAQVAVAAAAAAAAVAVVNQGHHRPPHTTTTSSELIPTTPPTTTAAATTTTTSTDGSSSATIPAVRQPRDMMREMLKAITELHKRMEATQQFGTQEDATQIIESFRLPIRLMKEALERSSGQQ